MMKKIVLSALLSILLLSGCADKKEYIVFDGFALGTTYVIRAGGMRDTTGIRTAINSVLKEANASMSIFDPGSLLSRLNRNETDSVDSHIAYCVELARRFSEASGGMYDITVKPLTDAWGFGAGNGESREIPEVDEILQYVDYDKIRIVDGRLVKDDPRVQIDLNSVAKGYIVDLVAGVIKQRGATDFLVEIGGEIYCEGLSSRGDKWVVAIDKPIDNNFTPGQYSQTYLQFSGKGLATSGNYRRFYIDSEGHKVTHTINALTGQAEPSNLLSATVVADNCATADAAATMMMTIGLKRSRQFLDSTADICAMLIYSGEGEQFDVYTSPEIEKMIKRIDPQ